MSADLAMRPSLAAPMAALWALAVGHTVSFVVAGPLYFESVIRVLAYSAHDPWLPFLLQIPHTFIVPLALLFGIGAAASFRPSVPLLRLWSWTCFLTGAVLLCHQAGLGWAGSVLFFWTGLWALWLAYVRTAARLGPLISLAIVGVLFAYPAIGKMTPGYWSGELYWEFHWRSGQGPHAWLGSVLGEERHRALGAIYGPISIIAEASLALVWLLPARIGYALVFLAAIGITASAGLRFLDAMGPLISLAASGAYLLFLQRERRSGSVAS